MAVRPPLRLCARLGGCTYSANVCSICGQYRHDARDALVDLIAATVAALHPAPRLPSRAVPDLTDKDSRP